MARISPHKARRAETLRTAIIALGILVAYNPFVLALDPSLDVNQYAHTVWKVSEGFSKGAIRPIVQTPDGYLWLGTEFGLLRFDGVRAVPWQPPVGEHLPSSDIRSLYVAHDGSLWIGTYRGLVNWKESKLSHYPKLDGLIVESILEDREGTVWVVAGWTLSEARLCSIRSGDTHCYGEDGGPGFGVTSIYEDSAGNLWAGAMLGVWRWKPGPPKLYPMAGPAQRIYGLVESDDGGILIARHGGITKLRNGKFENVRIPARLQFRPGKLLRDRDGSLWAGAMVDQGLLHIHQGKMDVFTPADGVSGDLSGDSVRDLFEDREGNVWVSTPDGLDRFRNFAVATLSVQQGLSSRGVSSVLAGHDGSIWVGTSDGLTKWTNGQITIYRKRGRVGTLVGGLTAAQLAEPEVKIREIFGAALPHDEVNSLFEDDRGSVWVATTGGVDFVKNDRLFRVDSVPPGNVLSMTGDRAGNLWLSHDQGLFHLHQGVLVDRIPWSSFGRKEPPAALLHDAAQDGLWVGFREGGVVLLKDGQVRALYGAAQGLAEGTVHSFYRDRSGTLWAATVGGLSRIKDGSAVTLTSRHGLPCDDVQWMMDDDLHSVWLYAGCGLMRIARSDLDDWVSHPKRNIQATVFDASDGVKSHVIVSGFSPIVAKGMDGRLWFCTTEGIRIVDPRHLLENKQPPPVHIEQIVADDKPYDATNGTRLPAGVRNLAIDYTALSLVVPEKVRFRYKLEDQNRNWHEVVNDREVQYTNLGPGNYRFRVLACNNSGVWNEEGASLDFVIPPMWYQTNWFLAACVAAFLGMIWEMYQLRVRQLQRNVKKLRDVVETIPAMVFEVGPDGTGAFANRRWLEYTGFPLQQQGRFAPDDPVWRASTGIHPDDLDGYVKLWERAIATGEPFELETRVRRADGVYRLFLARHVPLRDKQGKILKWYGTLTDIEERKRAEQELRESETRFRTFVDHAGDALFVVDVEQGTIVDVNRQACESLGYTREELIGKTPVRFHLDSDHAGVEAADKRAAAGEPVSDRHSHRRKDGSTFPVEVQSNRVSYAGRHFLLKVARDISDRVRAEEQREKLRQVEADLAHMGRVSMLGELVASLAHELNQPITGAITSANACLRWLARETPEVERARAAAMRIEKDGNRAAGIISRLRAFYKKGAPPQRESVVLGEVIDDITVLLRNQASRYSITIRTELAVGFPNVFADRVQLQQVFMNLMLNAIDAMKDTGGELTVRSQPTDNALLMLSVSDTGVGLPAENADQIFKAFFTTKPQGTGMGLAITRSIVEAHGGRLWASNNAERGATFFFTLPADAGAMNEQSAVADGFHH